MGTEARVDVFYGSTEALIADRLDTLIAQNMVLRHIRAHAAGAGSDPMLLPYPSSASQIAEDWFASGGDRKVEGLICRLHLACEALHRENAALRDGKDHDVGATAMRGRLWYDTRPPGSAFKDAVGLLRKCRRIAEERCFSETLGMAIAGCSWEEIMQLREMFEEVTVGATA